MLGNLQSLSFSFPFNLSWRMWLSWLCRPELGECGFPGCLQTLSFGYSYKIKILKDIGCELQKIHKNSGVHCDIKPENIMYNKNKNKWTLIDFDCCTCNNSETILNVIVGTLGYMAPQWRMWLCLAVCSPWAWDNISTRAGDSNQSLRGVQLPSALQIWILR